MRERMRSRHRRIPGSSWTYVVVTWLAGVTAAVGLGAVSPAGPALRSSLGLSAGALAWATSSLTAVGAVLGVPAGWWIGRFGAHRAVSLGLLVMAGAAAASAMAGSWGLLLASRMTEGVGYLLVFVAGPVVLTRTTEGGKRSAALALWGTCVPTGLAIAAATGGVLASRWTWNRWLGLTALVLLIMVAVTTAVLPRLPSTPAPRPRGHAGTWTGALRIGAAYASLSLVGVALVTVLPLFLTEHRKVTPAVAGTVVALASLSSAVGGLVASRLLRRGVAFSSFVPFGAVMPVACLPAFSARFPLAVSAGAATLVLLVNGLLISAVFAALPAAVSREQVDVANGILNQLGSAGIMMGPPLYGLAIAWAGWGTVAAVSFVFGGTGAVLLLMGTRASTTRTAPGTSRAFHTPDGRDAGKASEPAPRAPDAGEPRRNRI